MLITHASRFPGPSAAASAPPSKLPPGNRALRPLLTHRGQGRGRASHPPRHRARPQSTGHAAPASGRPHRDSRGSLWPQPMRQQQIAALRAGKSSRCSAVLAGKCSPRHLCWGRHHCKGSTTLSARGTYQLIITIQKP